MNFKRSVINEIAANVTDGEHASVLDDLNGTYFLLSNKNIKNGKIIYDESDRRINQTTFSNINRRTKLANGDVVISTVGSIGRTAIINEQILKFDFQRSVGIIKPNEIKLYAHYLHYYLQIPSVQKRLINLSKGAVQKCLFISDLREIEIDHPINVEEQKRLVSILKKIDSKIELNNRINAELEEMAKTLYDYWFVQFDFPDNNGKPYKTSGGKMIWNEELKREVPEGWADGELQDIANIIMGQSPPGESYNENGDGEIFYQGCTDFGSRFPSIRQYTTEPSRFAKKGDILLSVRAPVGTMNIAINDCCIGRGLASLNSKQNCIPFLYEVLRNLKQVFERRNTDGTTFGAITKDDLFSLKVVIPNDTILKSFSSILIPVFEKQNILALENQKLTELRDWLLPMLMNGQVKVKEEKDTELSMAAESVATYKKSRI